MGKRERVCRILQDPSLRSIRNHSGQSINYYDPTDKKWHQSWVGSTADIRDYVETNSGEGILQFLAEAVDLTVSISGSSNDSRMIPNVVVASRLRRGCCPFVRLIGKMSS